jgi:hypothetical protein
LCSSRGVKGSSQPKTYKKILKPFVDTFSSLESVVVSCFLCSLSTFLIFLKVFFICLPLKQILWGLIQ